MNQSDHIRVNIYREKTNNKIVTHVQCTAVETRLVKTTYHVILINIPFYWSVDLLFLFLSNTVSKLHLESQVSTKIYLAVTFFCMLLSK